MLIAISALLVVSVTLNILLAHRVRTLAHGQSASITDRLLKIGATVPPIAAKRLDGQKELISYQGTNQPTVLYIFTPPCPWCERNMENLKTLVDKGSDDYRFIGLSLTKEGLAQYVTKNELRLRVYSDLSPEALKTYKLGGTPQTIVVSPEGRVLQNWMGAYAGERKSQVEAFFHVSLPGLRELPEAKPATN